MASMTANERHSAGGQGTSMLLSLAAFHYTGLP